MIYSKSAGRVYLPSYQNACSFHRQPTRWAKKVSLFIVVITANQPS